MEWWLLLFLFALATLVTSDYVCEMDQPPPLSTNASMLRNHVGLWRATHPLPGARWCEAQVTRQWARRADLWLEPQDDQSAQQWFLQGQGNGVVAHANVEPVWAEGYFGQNVLLLVVDDGVNVQHADLAGNYAGDKHSFNYVHNNKNIGAVNGQLNHGTPVASTCCGVNNRASGDTTEGDECGVGSAPKAKFAVVRDLDVVSDADTAEVLRHDVNAIDIFILTAGASDSGRSAEAVGRLTNEALLHGVSVGRSNGRGALFVWAAGNGGQAADDCNFDGFVAHRATIAVGAVGGDGRPTYYSERCAAMLAVAPSSGAGERARGGISGMMVAANRGCSDNWGGTSGAAPLAAGVMALWLSARPSLSWLDIQGILAYSSSRTRVADEFKSSFQTNGAGLPFSHHFGFGVIDAAKGLEVLKRWSAYPLDSLASVSSGTLNVDKVIISPATVSEDGLDYTVARWHCSLSNEFVVKWIEVGVEATHGRRGDLQVELVSPQGTKSILAHARPLDSARNLRFTFTSVAHWDELPKGPWELRVRDTALSVHNGGRLSLWRATLHYSKPNNFARQNAQHAPAAAAGGGGPPFDERAPEPAAGGVASSADGGAASGARAGLDPTLGTDVEGLLWVVIGSAVCVIGVGVLIVVIVLSRRRKALRRTQYDVGSSLGARATDLRPDATENPLPSNEDTGDALPSAPRAERPLPTLGRSHDGRELPQFV